MIIYARVVKNLIAEINVQTPTSTNSKHDFCIEYDSDIVEYALSDIYYKSNDNMPSKWAVTSISNDPITFVATLVPPEI